MNAQELEVKFHISDAVAFEGRLRALNAHQVHPRLHETNLRFDTPDQQLTRSLRVLRLRQDNGVHLTYKGPSWTQEGVRVRQEIEIGVDDFNAARALLEALGYQVTVMYEKYRTSYRLDENLITLDEMPYGHFVEVEGPDPACIYAVCQRLGLDWEKRITESYLALFERLRAALGLSFRDLSFANFAGIQSPMRALEIYPADAQDIHHAS